MKSPSDSTIITHEKSCLLELSRYLRIRRKFWDRFGSNGYYLMDFLIVQSVRDCKRAGLIKQAREILSKAEFDNAQLPKFKELETSELAELLLSRLKRITRLLEKGKHYKKAQKRQKNLERALKSTYSDLIDLGLELLAIKILSNAGLDENQKTSNPTLAHQ